MGATTERQDLAWTTRDVETVGVVAECPWIPVGRAVTEQDLATRRNRVVTEGGVGGGGPGQTLHR